MEAAPVGNMTPSESGQSCNADGSDAADNVKDSLMLMGTIMVIAASFVSCFGLNLQKLSHNRNEEQEEEDRQPMWRSWIWVLGLICMVMGSILDMVALPFVPLSRVSALGASGMLANILITPIFLGEKLTKHDIVGGVITVAGTTMACIFGASTEPKLTSYCLLENFTEKLFILYAIVLSVFLAVLYYLIVGFRKKQAKMVEAGHVAEFMECVWLWDNLELLDTVGKDSHSFVFITKFGPQFYPVVHAVFAGTFGAQSVMFAKAVLIFFRNAVSSIEVEKSIFMLFLFLIPTVFCLWFQIGYLNLSLQIYRDALFVLPVYQSMWISIGIISGLIFYQEYRDIDGYSIAWFAAGVCIVLVGLVILTKRSSKTPEIGSPCKTSKQVQSNFDDQDTATLTGRRSTGLPSDLKNISFNQVLAPGMLAESFSLLQDYKAQHAVSPEKNGTVLEDAPLLSKQKGLKKVSTTSETCNGINIQVE